MFVRDPQERKEMHLQYIKWQRNSANGQQNITLKWGDIGKKLIVGQWTWFRLVKNVFGCG